MTVRGLREHSLHEWKPSYVPRHNSSDNNLEQIVEIPTRHQNTIGLELIRTSLTQTLRSDVLIDCLFFYATFKIVSVNTYITRIPG